MMDGVSRAGRRIPRGWITAPSLFPARGIRPTGGTFSCRAGGTRTYFIVRIPLAAEPVINLTEERSDES